MEEITNEILRVFEDLQRMQFKQRQNGVGDSDKDSYGYAFEPFDAFSTKPLEFSETALRLDIEAREMFAMLRTVNRHSPLFYKLSGQFEKMVSLLGSCCITKAVLEKQENEAFELLQDLTIDSLREMAAFNFRKCSAAFMDSRSCGKTNLGAFALSLRWAAVDKRLVATEAKIKSGQWSVVRDQLPEAEDNGAGCPEAQTCAGGNRHHCQEDDDAKEQPVFAFAEKGRPFRVIGEIRNQESEIRNDLSSQQETKGTVFADSALSQQNCPDRPGMQEKEGQAKDKIRNQISEIRNRFPVPGSGFQQDERQGAWGMEQAYETGVYWKDPPEEEWEEEAMVPEWAVVK